MSTMRKNNNGQEKTQTPRTESHDEGSASSEKESIELSLSQDFTKRLVAVYNGSVSQPQELFEPLAQLDDTHNEFVCTLEDPTARQLFSLMFSLIERSRHLKAPRKPREVEDFEKKLATIERQTHLVNGLFWEQVKATVPKCDVPGRTIVIGRGWQLGLTVDRGEQIKKFAIEHLGMPPELAELAVKLELDPSRLGDC